jgi:hypothetical protein
MYVHYMYVCTIGKGVDGRVVFFKWIVDTNKPNERLDNSQRTRQDRSRNPLDRSTWKGLKQRAISGGT